VSIRRSRVLPVGVVLGAGLLLAGCLPSGPPAPSVGTVFTGYSFDTCKAPTTTQMATWSTQSPYHAVGIYVGGSSAACPPGSGSNPNLTPGWVSTVESQGWRLLPLYVGDQAPCTSFNHRIPGPYPDPGTDGLNEANDAVAKASALGIGGGSPIYFDMEAYGRDQACIDAVRTFLSYWSSRVRQWGYVPGLYASGASGITDTVTTVANHLADGPDEIWIADWLAGSGQPCGPPPASPTPDKWVPDSMWSNHQRHRQFCGGETESWGGVALNIDDNVSDGMVASH
jgi:hypothetical protein